MVFRAEIVGRMYVLFFDSDSLSLNHSNNELSAFTGQPSKQDHNPPFCESDFQF